MQKRNFLSILLLAFSSLILMYQVPDKYKFRAVPDFLASSDTARLKSDWQAVGTYIHDALRANNEKRTAN